MKAIIFSSAKKPILPGIKGNVTQLDLSEIDKIKRSSLTELECFDVLESSEDDNILDSLMSKLRTGGMLKLKGTDARQVCKVFDRGHIGEAELTDLLINNKIRAVSVADILQKVSNNKEMSIAFAGVSGTGYVVEVKRN
jgi:hypothetical protein